MPSISRSSISRMTVRWRKARIRELSILGKYGVEAYIGGGTRENEYVKENGVWRIKSDHLYLTYLAQYDKGWAHGALPAPGPEQDTASGSAALGQLQAVSGFSRAAVPLPQSGIGQVGRGR